VWHGGDLIAPASIKKTIRPVSSGASSNRHYHGVEDQVVRVLQKSRANLASAFATMNTSAAEGDDRTIRDTLLAELKAQKFAEVSRPVSPSRTASSCGVLMFICPNRRTERCDTLVRAVLALSDSND
jgi:hypothetical protein